MKRLLSAAFVIARRDYVAAVFSRTFLFFLIGPVLIFAMVGLITFVSSGTGKPQPAPTRVAIAFPARDADRIDAARQRVTARLGDGFLPQIERVSPLKPAAASALLLHDRSLSAVLSGDLAAPTLTAIGSSADDVAGPLGLLIDDARATPGEPVSISRRTVSLPAAPHPSDNTDLARGAQVALFFFILLLAGMLLSNFIEEKGNKVIEVLAAAVPVDAIFVGKLAGMLAISVTAILVWGIVGGVGAASLQPGALSGLGTPAVGWPLFCLLGVVYFAMIYLLIGAVFLGIGSRASSPRDVQMMSLPVTMGQAVLLAFSSMGVGHQDGWLAISAAIFPWSSPLAMIGRAAELPTIWPHLAALAWQAIWLVLAIRFASRRFRVAVLKSGGGGSKRRKA